MAKFQIGDWVGGKTVNGELIRGYVEGLHEAYSSVKVRVIASDNEEAIGRVAETHEDWIRRLRPLAMTAETELYNMIDVALASGDKEWFMELTRELNALANKKDTAGRERRFTFSYPNRIDFSGRV